MNLEEILESTDSTLANNNFFEAKFLKKFSRYCIDFKKCIF